MRYVTHAHFDSLFTGVLIALSERKIRQEAPKKICRFKPVVSIALCITMLLAGFFFDTFLNNMNIKYSCYTILGCIIIFLMAKSNGGWFDFGKTINNVLDFIGDASASTYISHVILYSCIYYNTSLIPDLIKNTWWGVTAQVVFLETIAIFVGWVSMLLIEKPFGLLSKKRTNIFS